MLERERAPMDHCLTRQVGGLAAPHALENVERRAGIEKRQSGRSPIEEIADSDGRCRDGNWNDCRKVCGNHILRRDGLDGQHGVARAATGCGGRSWLVRTTGRRSGTVFDRRGMTATSRGRRRRRQRLSLFSRGHLAANHAAPPRRKRQEEATGHGE